jgi:hypothetical protein
VTVRDSAGEEVRADESCHVVRALPGHHVPPARNTGQHCSRDSFGEEARHALGAERVLIAIEHQGRRDDPRRAPARTGAWGSASGRHARHDQDRVRFRSFSQAFRPFDPSPIGVRALHRLCMVPI